jgi:hypothetical protein
MLGVRTEESHSCYPELREEYNQRGSEKWVWVQQE